MGKMCYPKGRMVIVRDCTVAICNNNNPASVLLSTLLFWHDNPRPGDCHDEQEKTFTMCRKQSDIEQQSCNQINVKTIHDTAVPFLQLFGYLTVKEKMNGNLYTLHIDRIEAGYATYERGPQSLKDFLKSSLQLESAPIEIPSDQLESILINKSRLYFELERVLIATRVGSNCKRGRKPRVEAGLDSENMSVETIRESKRIYREKESTPSTPNVPETGTVDSFIPSLGPDELVLIEWLEEKGIYVADDETAKREYLDKLAPLNIKSREDAHKLVAIGKQVFPKYNDLSLGNLVHKRVLNAWKQEQNAHNSPVAAISGALPSNSDEQGEGLTRIEYDHLMGSIEEHGQGKLILATDVDEERGRFYIGIATSSTTWLDIGRPEDWYYLPQEQLNEAIAYGAGLERQSAA